MPSSDAAASRRPVGGARVALSSLVALALFAGAAPVSAATPPALAGTTRITASGSRGAILTVPRAVALDASRATLSVTGGSYAFAAVVPAAGCSGITCVVFPIWSFPSLASAGPAFSQPKAFPTPSALPAGRLDVYVVTDGKATLELRPKGLAGSATVAATRPFSGTVRPLPSSCAAPAGCDAPTGYAGRIAYGGATSTVARTGGFAASVVVAAVALHETAGTTHAQNAFARACLYPWYDYQGASANAVDYPFGCRPVGDDDNPRHQSNTNATLAVAQAAASPAQGVLRITTYPQAAGPQYVGFQTAAAGHDDPVRGAWGVWMSYGL